MTAKKLHLAIPFLIAILLIPTSEMSFAEKNNAIYDPVVTEYVKKVISQEGKNTEKKVIDGQKVSVTTTVKELQDNRYKIKSITRINGDKVSTEIFKITIDKYSFRLENKKQGINQVFINSTDVVSGQGYGSSSKSGAKTVLYDREYGTPHTLKLYDNYSACATLNQAVFQATIRPNTVDVTWEASPYYLHWCLVPHEFDHGEVKYGTVKVSLDGHSDRRGSHAFTNAQGGTTWYSVGTTFVYGGW